MKLRSKRTGNIIRVKDASEYLKTGKYEAVVDKAAAPVHVVAEKKKRKRKA